MNVLVTGATGGAGSWIVEHLSRNDHEVVGVDLDRPKGTLENATFLQGNLTDQGQTWELIQSVRPDAIVHCAAIPAMGIAPGTETFFNNVQSTYNVLVAAGTVSADVVWTSSESIYGTVFAEETWLPDYFPIDESHPMRPEDPYGTSKLVGETIADMVTRKYGISVTSIRPSWINYPGRYETGAIRDSFDLETAQPHGNFWSYVDIRDVVSLVTVALAADIDGHESYLAVADETFLDRSIPEVIQAVYGEIPDQCTLSGDDAAISNRKAKDELGWSPSYTWRDAETTSDPDAEPTFL